VLGIAKDFNAEGVDLLGTNSFGGNRFKLERYGLGDRVFELNKAAAEISREVAGQHVIILGSIGPTGKFLLSGEVTETELYEAFSEQAVALEAGGADAACIETMSDIAEALCAVRAVKENTSMEIICTFTFEQTRKEEYHTMMGVSPLEMAQALLVSGTQVIGANCGNGIRGMIQIVKQIRQFDQKVPILIHANVGIPVFQEGRTVFCESPEEMARWVPELIDAGANIIGGCCGATAAYIRAIKNTILQRH
jgi:5-methyltetrahydrofolate--homocysteine methyltransferase